MRDKNNHIDDQIRESVGEFEQSPPEMLWASINPTNNGVTVNFKLAHSPNVQSGGQWPAFKTTHGIGSLHRPPIKF